MMRLSTFLLVLAILCVVLVVSLQADSKTMEPRTVYRIRTEEGVEVTKAKFTPDEERAVARLQNMMAKWPSNLWLASNNGKLVLLKMGSNGKPETVK